MPMPLITHAARPVSPAIYTAAAHTMLCPAPTMRTEAMQQRVEQIEAAQAARGHEQRQEDVAWDEAPAATRDGTGGAVRQARPLRGWRRCTKGTARRGR